MAVFTPDKIDEMLTDIHNGDFHQVYLLFGERFLCQQAAEKICNKLTEGGGNCHMVDGETEEFSTTLNRLASYSLFPGRQVYRVMDTKLFHSIKIARSLWKKAADAHRGKELEKATRYLKTMLESVGLDASDQDNDPGSLPATQWKKLFGFTKPQENLAWTGPLLSELAADVSTVQTTIDDATVLLEKTLKSGIPAKNHLVLLAEEVDKRKRLYKYLAKNQIVINLGVESGSSSKAQTAQKAILNDLLRKTLAGFDKTIAPKVAEILFERVGFHPVAVAMEAEKLALYIGSRKEINIDDLNELIGRTRQEAVFELTGAIGEKNLEQSLLLSRRLVDNGIHPLAIIATIKNYTRTLLLFRALQEKQNLGYNKSMQPGAFQKNILPALKEDSPWTKELSGHPYALFMQFKTAAGFELSTLQNWMKLILDADFRLKGSPIVPETIMQHLLISMLAKK